MKSNEQCGLSGLMIPNVCTAIIDATEDQECLKTEALCLELPRHYSAFSVSSLGGSDLYSFAIIQLQL
jgi:hypothetical protein